MSEQQKIADQWLVLKYQSGDIKALSALVERWHRKLIYHSYVVVKDKEVAKDIVQDSWTVIINKIKSLKDPQRFQFWANSIVHNKSVDWIRRQQKQRKEEQNITLQSKDVQEHEEARDHEYETQAMIKELGALPDSQRTILTLFYLRDQSVREISLILNIPVGTVKSRLYTAREHLKNIIKTKYYETE